VYVNTALKGISFFGYEKEVTISSALKNKSLLLNSSNCSLPFNWRTHHQVINNPTWKILFIIIIFFLPHFYFAFLEMLITVKKRMVLQQ